MLTKKFQQQFERLELKYLIDEVLAREIRGRISAYCSRDPHCPVSGVGYSTNSLYLDSPGLAFHEAKERGDPDRVKLRIRTYSDTSPAILEIKRRRSQVIFKTRGVVDRERAQEAALGLTPDVDRNPFLDDFAFVLANSGAEPTLCVSYEREAYESTVDEYTRITFDRKIEVSPSSDWSLSRRTSGVYCFDDYWKTDHTTTPVVLEIKCETGSIPWWVTDLIRHHDLVQSSFSKYSIGIHLSRARSGLRAARSRTAQVLG
ncbi:MAG: polyphosphate polymerase domain-containing protein [Proteobacteria bacterium]|nr:polyphosphate polymerase domain-containing protein [Pseudomonadota bacterium]